MDQTTDNKSAPSAAPTDTVEALQARLKAAETDPHARDHRTTNDTVTSTVQAPSPATPPEGPKATPPAPPSEGKKDGLDQFKDKDGNVDDGKIRKANEHLERGIRDREELLRKNKELLAKFTKDSQELAATRRELETRQTATPPPAMPTNEDEAFLKRVAELENNPIALRDLIDETAARRTRSLEERLSRFEAEERNRTQAMELQQLVEAGHAWIIKEGLGRFEDVFKEKPFLLQSRTPYLDALRFMENSSGAAPAPAQGGTPILGGGSATPPPSSAPTVTPEQRMGELSKQFHLHLQRGQVAEAGKVMEEMNRLNRGY